LSAKQRRDSREERRVESFLADTAEMPVPTEAREGNNAPRAARDCAAANLDDFDQRFKSVAKNKPI
jgi:hypothetical protein